MVVYHGTWFATDAGLVDVPIHTHLGWVAFQKSIAGTFFALVGLSLQLTAPVRARPFMRRLALVLGGAAIVTTTSIVLDANRVVTFGILHAIALCSVVAVPFLRVPTPVLLLLAAIATTTGIALHHPTFDHSALHWTGLSPHVPATFDHQPFLPWFGAVLGGLALGRWLPNTSAARWPLDGPLPRGLALLGRHSLFLYMAHVPVLVVIIAALVALS